jgi:hypothetical protein
LDEENSAIQDENFLHEGTDTPEQERNVRQEDNGSVSVGNHVNSPLLFKATSFI